MESFGKFVRARAEHEGHLGKLRESLSTQKAQPRRVDDQYVKRPFGLVLSVLILVAGSYAADPGYVLHKRVSEVRLTLVATDSSGRPWQGLSASSLAVSDEGQAIGEFQLRSANDLPLRIGIMLDLSDSTLQSWPAVRSALTESMKDLVRPGDQILMTSFNTKIQMQMSVARPEELAESLPSSSGGLTALYDAVYRTSQHPVFSEGGEPRRSAIIVFSDGEDTFSCRGLADAVASAVRNGVAIYTIATHKPNSWRRGDGVLRHLAASTGGRDFVVKDHAALQAALQTIHDELRSSYLLYFSPLGDQANGGFRRVEVLPAQNANLRLRTRMGYYEAP